MSSTPISVKLSPQHRLVEELSAEARLYPLYLMFWESRLVDRYSLYLSDPVKFAHCKFTRNPTLESKGQPDASAPDPTQKQDLKP